MKLYPTLLRSTYLTLSLVLGAALGQGYGAVLPGLLLGLLSFLLLLLFENQARMAHPATLAAAMGGALAFALAGRTLWPITGLKELPVPATLLYLLLLAGIGFVTGASGARAFRSRGEGRAGVTPKVVDTSTLIDGRVVELVRLGFLPGTLYLPQFMLREAQLVADSPDAARRARGRRGLGSAEKLQALEGVEVLVTEEDFTSDGTVDAKLVAFARAKGADLVTTDYNLEKVAQLQGVRVLNVHQLSQALRPVVMAGDRVRVTVQKEGREPGQGVGYLEDGTMVVVENGASHLEESLEVAVVSVLQTSAGRLVFAKLSEEGEEAVEARGPRRARGRG